MYQKENTFFITIYWGGPPTHIVRQYGSIQNWILDTNNFSSTLLGFINWMGCIHLIKFPKLHCLGCTQLVAFTWLHQLVAFNWLHWIRCLYLILSTWLHPLNGFHSPYWIPLVALSLLHLIGCIHLVASISCVQLVALARLHSLGFSHIVAFTFWCRTEEQMNRQTVRNWNNTVHSLFFS